MNGQTKAHTDGRSRTTQNPKKQRSTHIQKKRNKNKNRENIKQENNQANKRTPK